MSLPNRNVITKDIHGRDIFAESQFVSNAAEVGSVGRGVASSGLSITTSAYTELSAGLSYRKSIALYLNTAGVTVFLGPSGNGTGNMYPLAGSGGQISFNVTSGVKIYGISDNATANLRIIEIG